MTVRCTSYSRSYIQTNHADNYILSRTALHNPSHAARLCRHLCRHGRPVTASGCALLAVLAQRTHLQRREDYGVPIGGLTRLEAMANSMSRRLRYPLGRRAVADPRTVSCQSPGALNGRRWTLDAVNQAYLLGRAGSLFHPAGAAASTLALSGYELSAAGDLRNPGCGSVERDRRPDATRRASPAYPGLDVDMEATLRGSC